MPKARLVITAVVVEGRSHSEVVSAYGVSQQPSVSQLVARGYYLDGRSRTLHTEASDDAASAGYDTQANPGLASFTVRFDDETILVGYPKAHSSDSVVVHERRRVIILRWCSPHITGGRHRGERRGWRR